ncbi:MAG: replication-relaxation family protein [Actinomycetota bacterium]
MEQKAVSVARSLDEREREMLRALFDYELLLTYQIRVLFFSSPRRAQDVTKKLSDLGLIEKDPPHQAIGIGKPQPMWAITEDGVRVLAVITAKPRSAIDWMPRYSYHDEKRRGLDHLLGVNRFFVSLVQASLLHQGHGLQKWVAAKQVVSNNNWVTHDGFGRYQHSVGACDFYFEYDRATEWHDQLVRKLRGYILMAIKWTEEGTSQSFPNLLVLVPTEKREKAFDRAMKAAVDSLEVGEAAALGLPFFIASEDLLAEQGVLAKVWRRFVPPPPDRPMAPYLLAERLSLVELPAFKAGPFDLEQCLGKKWSDAGAYSRLKRRRTPPTFPAGEPPKLMGDEIA